MRERENRTWVRGGGLLMEWRNMSECRNVGMPETLFCYWNWIGFMKIQPTFIITMGNNHHPTEQNGRALRRGNGKARTYFTIRRCWARQRHNTQRTNLLVSYLSHAAHANAKSESNHVCRHVPAKALQISCHVYNIYLPVRFPFFSIISCFQPNQSAYVEWCVFGAVGRRPEQDGAAIAEGSSNGIKEEYFQRYFYIRSTHMYVVKWLGLRAHLFALSSGIP